MPIYEYQCEKCGTFEVTQRISESPLRRCPTCKSKVTKLLSAPSFQFKGSGWYVTDYGSKGRGGGEGKSESGSSEKKDAKASESKSKEGSDKPSKASAESKAA